MRPFLDPATALRGRVVAVQANFCSVVLDQEGPLAVSRLLCTRRSRLVKTGQRIFVGDRVRVEGVDWSACSGAVAALEPRGNLLVRPSVANVNRVVVVASLAEPPLDPWQLSRFLITAEAAGVPVELVLSKADLLPAESLRARCGQIAAWPYEVTTVSTHTGQGLPQLRQRLAQAGIAVLCGPSGVGKSSLLNALAPELKLRVNAVSGRLLRGRHTTRHVELFALPGAADALVADTPGFNRPELPMDPATLAGRFPEVRERLEGTCCRFADCRHREDPGCVVGHHWDRHAMYLECLAEVEAATAQGKMAKPMKADRITDCQWNGMSRPRSRPRCQDELSPPDQADSDPDHR